MLTLGRYGTNDIVRAKAFYDAVTAPLGAIRVLDRHGAVGYRGPEGGLFIIGTPREGDANVGNGSQMSFRAPSRTAVDECHAKAIELGAECLGTRGPRGSPETKLYAAYFRDLDGNKIMVLHTGE
jgi:hypothetical protein